MPARLLAVSRVRAVRLVRRRLAVRQISTSAAATPSDRHSCALVAESRIRTRLTLSNAHCPIHSLACSPVNVKTATRPASTSAALEAALRERAPPVGFSKTAFLQ